ncbi:uncharacterized protein [Manis javanica]|uniref:uncharacterized protein n=1 Tax=Manis javanica TaxID=9974 RepID=UPI003C6DB076
MGQQLPMAHQPQAGMPEDVGASQRVSGCLWPTSLRPGPPEDMGVGGPDGTAAARGPPASGRDRQRTWGWGVPTGQQLPVAHQPQAGTAGGCGGGGPDGTAAARGPPDSGRDRWRTWGHPDGIAAARGPPDSGRDRRRMWGFPTGQRLPVAHQPQAGTAGGRGGIPMGQQLPVALLGPQTEARCPPKGISPGRLLSYKPLLSSNAEHDEELCPLKDCLMFKPQDNFYFKYLISQL